MRFLLTYRGRAALSVTCATATAVAALAFALPWVASGTDVRTGYIGARALVASGLLSSAWFPHLVLGTVAFLPVVAGIAGAAALFRRSDLVAFAGLLGALFALPPVVLTIITDRIGEPGPWLALLASTAIVASAGALVVVGWRNSVGQHR